MRDTCAITMRSAYIVLRLYAIVDYTSRYNDTTYDPKVAIFSYHNTSGSSQLARIVAQRPVREPLVYLS